MPAHRFYRFGKHCRAGLQAPDRVSIVQNQESEFSSQVVEQGLGGQSAKRVQAFVGRTLGQPARDNPSRHGSR